MENTKFHVLALILAVIVGTATLLPQLIAIRSAGNDFNGVYPDNSSDELYYSARVKDIVDGHTFISNPYILEHKDGISAPFWVPDYFIALTSKVFF